MLTFLVAPVFSQLRVWDLWLGCHMAPKILTTIALRANFPLVFAVFEVHITLMTPQNVYPLVSIKSLPTRHPLITNAIFASGCREPAKILPSDCSITLSIADQ